MGGYIVTRNFVKAMVPISRFNKGEAGKIFNEVSDEGIKIVLKNNAPAGVILSPEVYEEIQETLENYRLLVEAEKRMEKAQDDDIVSSEEAMRELGISEDDLKEENAEF